MAIPTPKAPLWLTELVLAAGIVLIVFAIIAVAQTSGLFWGMAAAFWAYLAILAVLVWLALRRWFGGELPARRTRTEVTSTP